MKNTFKFRAGLLCVIAFLVTSGFQGDEADKGILGCFADTKNEMQKEDADKKINKSDVDNKKKKSSGKDVSKSQKTDKKISFWRENNVPLYPGKVIKNEIKGTPPDIIIFPSDDMTTIKKRYPELLSKNGWELLGETDMADQYQSSFVYKNKKLLLEIKQQTEGKPSLSIHLTLQNK